MFTLTAIPFLGWINAYIADFLGSMLGSSITFFLGKKYGIPILKKFFDIKTLDKIKSLKIKKSREIEAVIMLRITLGSKILEAISYGAGLLNLKFKNFLIGSVVAHLLSGIPIFYITNNAFQFKNSYITILLTLLGFALIYKFKGRYLE